MNSLISFIFTFGHVSCQVTKIEREGTRKPQDLLLGKNQFFSRSSRERYCQSFICFEHNFDPGLKPHTISMGSWNHHTISMVITGTEGENKHGDPISLLQCPIHMYMGFNCAKFGENVDSTSFSREENCIHNVPNRDPVMEHFNIVEVRIFYPF